MAAFSTTGTMNSIYHGLVCVSQNQEGWRNRRTFVSRKWPGMACCGARRRRGRGEGEEGRSKMRKSRATEEPHVCKQNLSNSWHLAIGMAAVRACY
jgi:hypothetical protein